MCQTACQRVDGASAKTYFRKGHKSKEEEKKRNSMRGRRRAAAWAELRSKYELPTKAPRDRTQKKLLLMEEPQHSDLSLLHCLSPPWRGWANVWWGDWRGRKGGRRGFAETRDVFLNVCVSVLVSFKPEWVIRSLLTDSKLHQLKFLKLFFFLLWQVPKKSNHHDVASQLFCSF